MESRDVERSDNAAQNYAVGLPKELSYAVAAHKNRAIDARYIR